MRIPTKATLDKYGLTEELWIEWYKSNDGKCHVCDNPFEDEKKDRISYVDHEHVKNYKKMSPEDKRQYIRGILCYQCNRRLLEKSNTLKRLRLGVAYLERYEKAKLLKSDSTQPQV
jgi:hypothetical protein